MNLFITSSPFLWGTNASFLNPENHFVDNLKEALPAFPRVLFVASDPERHDLTCCFAMDVVDAFKQMEIPFSAFQVLDGTNAEQAAELVHSSDFLVLAGGHVPTQNNFFREIGLREILRDFQGTVMGISAGSMNMADMAYIQPEEEGEGIDPDFVRFAPGLGLTEVNVLPHYQNCKDDMLDGLRLFEDITYPDSMGKTFFALPDGSYFFQNEDMLLLFGEGYLLRDGILSPLTRSGDCLNMAEFE